MIQNDQSWCFSLSFRPVKVVPQMLQWKEKFFSSMKLPKVISLSSKLDGGDLPLGPSPPLSLMILNKTHFLNWSSFFKNSASFDLTVLGLFVWSSPKNHIASSVRVYHQSICLNHFNVSTTTHVWNLPLKKSYLKWLDKSTHVWEKPLSICILTKWQKPNMCGFYQTHTKYKCVWKKPHMFVKRQTCV